MAKEILSKFREKPKTSLGWLAFGLGISSVLVGPILGTNAAVLRPFLDSNFGNIVAGGVTIGVAILAFSLVIVALTVAIRALRSGERSWAVWVGFVPALFSTLMLAALLVGEFLFPH